MLTKRKPVLAGIFGLVFGPLGYFYLGWRFAVIAMLLVLVFVGVLMVVDFDPAGMPGVRDWIRYPMLLAFAWRAYKLCTVRNALIEAQDAKAAKPASFPVVAMSMAEFLVELAVIYAIALGLFGSYLLFSRGSIVMGLLILLLGTPVMAWLGSLLFGFISMGLQMGITLGVAVRNEQKNADYPFRRVRR